MTLETGFPVKLTTSGAAFSPSGPGVNVVVANIDADPTLELLVSNQSGGPLGAWNSDGTAVRGWPVNGPVGYLALTAAGHLDPAIPGMEVVAVYSSSTTGVHQLVAYAGSGAILPGFPVNLATHISSAPVLANLVGDSRDEIIIGTQDGKLYVYQADGTLATGWPVQTSGQQTGTPIAVDLDNNPDLEIVFTTKQTGENSSISYLNAYHPDGTIVSGFPTSFRRDNAASAYLAAGDVDGDNQVEMVVPGLDPNNTSLIRIFSHTGTVEREILMPTFHIQMMTAPVLADLDGDKIPEILMQLASGIAVVRGNGSNFPGWPVSAQGWQINMTPIVGDITGDNVPEIISIAQNPGSCNGGVVLVYDRDGNPLNQFYKPLSFGGGGVPALADIDRDGRNELVIMSNRYCGGISANQPLLWAFDFGGQSHGYIQWGQFGNGAGHTGVYKAPQSTYIDLTTSITDTLDPFVAGGTTTYVIEVKNQGSGKATNVQVNDILPADSTLVQAVTTGGICTPITGSVTCQINEISNGGTAIVQVTVRHNTSGSITNIASASSSQPESDLSNNVDSETTTILPGTDLAVSYTFDQARYTVGDSVHLTVTISNQGLMNASNVRLTALGNSGLIYSTTTPSQGTYDSSLGIWNVGSIAAGQSATLEMIATVAPTTVSKQLTSQARITEVDQADPVISNNTAIITIPIDVVDLAVTMTATPVAPTQAAPFLTYRLSVKNNGVVSASGVTLNISLPLSQARIDAVGGSQGSYTAGLLTLGTILPGATATFSFQMIANAGTSGQILTAQANLQHVNQLDSNNTNNNASASVTINGVDLSVTSSVNPTSVTEGNPVTYTFVAQKLGANPITNAEILAALPAGMIYVSRTVTQGSYDSITGLWQTGALTGTSAAQLTVVATAGSGTGGRIITNTVHLNAATPTDYNPANDTATSNFTVIGADLRLLQTASHLIPAENDVVAFNLTLANLGPNTANGIVVNDLLPSGLTYQSHSASAGTTYDAVSGNWTVGSLTYSGSPTIKSLTISARVNAGTNGTRIDNTAQITTSSLPDPISTNNSATGTVSVGGADVNLSMLVNNPQVGEGSPITYTVRAQALAHKTASGVIIEDVLPPGLTYISSTPSSGSYDDTTGIWSLGTIAADTIVTLVINASVNAGTTGTSIVNLARITHTDSYDPYLTNNTASVSVTIGSSDLEITQNVDDITPDAGANIIYTLVVTNPAPYLVTGVVVKDLLPPGLIYATSATATGDYDPITGIWTIGNIAAAGNATLVITAQVDGSYYGQPIVNTSKITASNHPDPYSVNNQASQTITVNTANVGVSITDSADLLYVGGSYSYSIMVTNSGTVNATNVRVSIIPPTLVSVVSSSTSQGSGCDTGTTSFSCNLGSLPIGSSATVTINVQGLPNQSGLATLTATVSADQPELVTANNSDSETTGLNILTVNATNDINDGACSVNHCSLREAMLVSNALAGSNNISFNIPGTGIHRIQITSALATQTQPVVIDGTTQPGYAGAPLIELDGNLAGSNDIHGLYLKGGTSTVRGLAINGFSGTGIRLESNGGNTIQGNFIGLHADGVSDQRNKLDGVYFDSQAGNNLIGGTMPNDLNVIAGNWGWGINGNSSGNIIQGNHIGIDWSGARRGNWKGGISAGGNNNLIGGLTPESRNIISSNGNGTNLDEANVALFGSGTSVLGNYIGLNIAGDGAIITGSPSGIGIAIRGSNHLIGGLQPGAGNVIGGVGTAIAFKENGSPIIGNTFVRGNIIGLDFTGTKPIAVSIGILIDDDADSNIVGGTTPAARNVIANASIGIRVVADDNIIQGNFIGTDITGTVAMGNNTGIHIRGRRNHIGGTAAEFRNIIASSQSFGIDIQSSNYGTGNLIDGNYIGTDKNGLPMAVSGAYGVRVSGWSVTNTIGGTTSGAENKIVYVNSKGILIGGNDPSTITILSNQISGTGLGIDIAYFGVVGVTPNDSSDTDVGPNSQQNYPNLNSAVLVENTLSISGFLDSAANSTYRIEFFSNQACDTSGYGPGQNLIGAASVTIDASGIANFSFDFSDPTLVGQHITATATNSSNQTSEFSACIALDGADLALTGTVNTPVADVGNSVTYTLNLRNNGPATVSDIVVDAALPSGMTYQSDDSGGNYNSSTGEWTLDSLGVGNMTSIQIVAQINSGTNGTNITYTSTIEAASKSDFNSSNNSVTLQLAIGLADLDIALETSEPAPNVGDSLQLFTVVTNDGPGTANGINVLSLLPSELTFSNYLVTQGSYDSSTGIWTVGNLGSGTQASLTVTATVNSGTEGSTITGNTSITAAQQVDPVVSDNSAQVSIQVGIADLGVTSMADNLNPKPGDEVNFMILLTNDGPSDATSLEVESLVPQEITITNALATRGTYDTATGKWSLNSLDNDGVALLTLTGYVKSGSGGDTITGQTDLLNSDQIDLNVTNDSSSVEIIVQPEIDLEIVLDAASLNTPSAQQVTYTLTLTNLNETLNASAIAAKFAVPTQVNFVAVTASKGLYDPLTGIWAVGNLAASENATLTVITTVKNGIVEATFSGTATIVSAQLTDPNTANNTSTTAVTVEVILDAPTLLSPANGTEDTNRRPTLTWNSLAGALMFEVQLGTDNPPVTLFSDITSNSYTPAYDLPMTLHYWRVRAISISGDVSPWSEIHSFIVMATEADAPETGYFVGSSVELSWLPISWATGYEIEVDKASTFSTEYSFREEIENVASTTLQLPAGKYYWRVRAKRSATEWGDWSQTISFTVINP